MSVKVLRAAAAALAFSSVTTLATADESGGYDPNLYVSGAVGVGMVLDKDMVFTTVPGNNTFDFAFEPGIVLNGAVGTRLPYNLRVEVEAGWSNNDLQDLAGFGAGKIDTDGNVTATTFMLNALYDFGLTQELSLFAGVGAGVALIDADFTRGASNPAFILARGDETRFAYQAILGASYDVTNDIEVFGRYTYLGTLGDDFTVINSSGATPFQTKFDFDRHAISAGVTFHFGL